MAEDQQGYRVPEVCKAVGISYRQLDYWARTGSWWATGSTTRSATATSP